MAQSTRAERQIEECCASVSLVMGCETEYAAFRHGEFVFVLQAPRGSGERAEHQYLVLGTKRKPYQNIENGRDFRVVMFTDVQENEIVHRNRKPFVVSGVRFQCEQRELGCMRRIPLFEFQYCNVMVGLSSQPFFALIKRGASRGPIFLCSSAEPPGVRQKSPQSEIRPRIHLPIELTVCHADRAKIQNLCAPTFTENPVRACRNEREIWIPRIYPCG